MSKQGLEIRDVSDTSFWVAYYRAKETSREDALFHDPLAWKLIGDKGKKISDSMPGISRYTEWSVVARTVIIDRFIERLLSEGIDAVINLGAGLDTRPYRMKLPVGLEWIEVDYPNIIAHKERVLGAERSACRLARVAVDLSVAEARRAFLRDAAPRAKKILVLSEGVIPYLSPEQVSDLATDLLARPAIRYWITEYFHPRVYRYLRSTTRQMKMENAPFRFFPEDWYGFFRKTGWLAKETRYAGEIALEFGRELPKQPWMKYVMFLIPRRVKKSWFTMSGYVVLERGR